MSEVTYIAYCPQDISVPFPMDEAMACGSQSALFSQKPENCSVKMSSHAEGPLPQHPTSPTFITIIARVEDVPVQSHPALISLNSLMSILSSSSDGSWEIRDSIAA
jgi:hypothetical protein